MKKTKDNPNIEEQKKEVERAKKWLIDKRNYVNISALSRDIGVDASNFHKYLDGKQVISFESQSKIPSVLNSVYDFSLRE